MTSRNTRLGDAVAQTLTGLGLAAAIAREAVDAVPIVKQVLGVVVRILALAEKIDKDREALHALVDKSVQLAQRVREVLGDEEPDAKLLPSLERMYRSFHDVEAFMAKHVARNRFSRGLSYAFTVNHHVGRLSRSLDDALQEIFAVTLLTINSQARATHLIVEQAAQYDGDFRLIRHCQIDKLELLREEKHVEAGSIVVRYHRARVDGQLVVLRYCEGRWPQDSEVNPGSTETPYTGMIAYDSILEEVSTVQRSHTNVARIYGWGTGPIHNRFTVFKSGYISNIILFMPPDRIDRFIHCGAAHHLRTLGITWHPNVDHAFSLDEHLEPTIGLHNDLRRSDTGDWILREIELQVSVVKRSIHHSSWHRDTVSSENAREALAELVDERLDSVLCGVKTWERRRYIVTKAAFSNRYTLSDDNVERLYLLMDRIARDTYSLSHWAWPQLLLMLDANRASNMRTMTMLVIYTAELYRSDSIELRCLGEDSQQIVCDTYINDIPDAHRIKVRQMFDVPGPYSDLHSVNERIVYTSEGKYHVLQ